MSDAGDPLNSQEDGAPDLTEALTSSVAESMALRQLQAEAPAAGPAAPAGEAARSQSGEARRFLEKQSICTSSARSPFPT
jgi:hypothetical protein